MGRVWVERENTKEEIVKVEGRAVKKGGAMVKYNILPISLVYNHGFKPSELKMIEEILEDNEEIIAQHWNTFFNNAK